MPGAPEASNTGTEAAVMHAWSNLLPVPPTSTVDDFFDLGGQSLQLVHFLGFVHERFGLELEVFDLFRTGFTVANTAAAIDQAMVGAG